MGIFHFFVRFFSDRQVEKRYVRAGAVFGDAVSYLYMGVCVGFIRRFKTWARWEKEYASRGFRTVSIDAFIEHGGYGKNLSGIGKKREGGEEPIFHAERYRKEYLGKILPTPNLFQLDKPRTGTYYLPTTEE